MWKKLKTYDVQVWLASKVANLYSYVYTVLRGFSPASIDCSLSSTPVMRLTLCNVYLTNHRRCSSRLVQPAVIATL